MVVLLIVMLAGGVLAFLRLDIKAFPDPVPASAGKCGARSAAACVPITVVLLGVLPLVQFGTAADALPAAVSRGIGAQAQGPKPSPLRPNARQQPPGVCRQAVALPTLDDRSD